MEAINWVWNQPFQSTLCEALKKSSRAFIFGTTKETSRSSFCWGKTCHFACFQLRLGPCHCNFYGENDETSWEYQNHPIHCNRMMIPIDSEKIRGVWLQRPWPSTTFCGHFSPFEKLTFTTWRHNRNMSEGSWQLWHFAKGNDLSWLPSGLSYRSWESRILIVRPTRKNTDSGRSEASW